MKLSKVIFLILLFIIPLSSLLIKTKHYSLSLIPKTASNEWKIQTTYLVQNIFKEIEGDEIELPIFMNTPTQIIKSQDFFSGTRIEERTDDAGTLFKVRRGDNKKVSILTEVKLKETKFGDITKNKIEKRDLKKFREEYLRLKNVDSEILSELENLKLKFISPRDNAEEIVRKLYLYITEEIILNEKSKDLKEALALSEASELQKAVIFTLLARISNIPARINLTLKIGENDKGKETLKFTYLPEVIIKDNWVSVSINDTTFLRVPEKSFILYKDIGPIIDYVIPKYTKFTIAPVMMDRVDSMAQQQKLASVNKFLGLTSLHNLPLNMQNTFLLILLIPIGTLVLSLGRNVLGIKSFGIFTPILLTLFFHETSVIAGLIFFSFIIFIGFFERYVLDKFYLLAVPRLSILLTLVIISYTCFSLFAYRDSDFFPGGAPLNYLPIVIITGFIERSSVHFIEEGVRNTLTTLLGTAVISILCYLVFEIEFLKQLIFNNPELLLISIALNILIGNYKGYRLSELLRFKEFKRS